MDVARILKAIRAHEGEAVDHARGAPPELAEEIAEALPDLDDPARRIALRCLVAMASPGATRVLLSMVADDSPMIGASAAEALAALPVPPPVKEILATLKVVGEGFLRGQLYRLVGRTGAPSDLEPLRRASARERDGGAMVGAAVACAKLGGKEERAIFVDCIRNALPEQALAIGEELSYLGDPSLVRELLPWLDRTDPVLRLDGDNTPVVRMARMCDLAVWFARAHGVVIPGPMELTNYDADVIEAAKQALAAL